MHMSARRADTIALQAEFGLDHTADKLGVVRISLTYPRPWQFGGRAGSWEDQSWTQLRFTLGLQAGFRWVVTRRHVSATHSLYTTSTLQLRWCRQSSTRGNR